MPCLTYFSTDDQVTLAQYKLENNLLDTDSWKRFSGISNNQKKIRANQGNIFYYQYA